MLHKQSKQKQEPQFIIEIEPLRNNREYQKRRFLGYAGKIVRERKERI